MPHTPPCKLLLPRPPAVPLKLIATRRASAAAIFNSLCGPGGKYDTVREALKDLDSLSPDGTLSREDVKLYLKENYILKFVDFYTGMVRGAVSEEAVDTIMDLCDKNGDGAINYEEFSSVVMAGANTYYDMTVAQRGVAII